MLKCYNTLISEQDAISYNEITCPCITTAHNTSLMTPPKKTTL